MSAPDFWNDREAAQNTVRELQKIKATITPYNELAEKVNDIAELYQLAVEENDAQILAEIERDLPALEVLVERFELQTVMSGEADHRNVYMTIHAGAGGTESCDWVAMLLRMYLRWAESHKYKVEMLEENPGEEAGIKSVMVHISGTYLYGYLRSEIGVHRLVRISPFDSANRRHTSFAAVDVTPEYETSETKVEIDEKDLRIDTYRAGGKGGQHVNVTDSAVRITHLPTGLVVQCQNERSQHRNKDSAMKVLLSRLEQFKHREREAELLSMYGEKGEIAWGNQIRSYVLQPYQLIKDHRSGYESGNVPAILDGDIDDFIQAYLRFKAGKGKK